MPNPTPNFMSKLTSEQRKRFDEALEKFNTNPFASSVRAGKSAAMSSTAADWNWVNEVSAVPDSVWDGGKITPKLDQRNDPEKVGELLAQMAFKLANYDARLEKAEKRIQDLEGIIDAINDPSAGSF